MPITPETGSLFHAETHLLEAKSLLQHGEFQPWIKENFGWSLSTAQKLMNVAADPKSVNFTDLPKAAQYALAAPSTPEKVKDAVIADMKAGKKPTVKLVQTKIAATKPAKIAAPLIAAGGGEAVALVTAKASIELVERLKAVGLETALAAVEAAFPGVDLHAELKGMEAA
jgi:hypothetical protein